MAYGHVERTLATIRLLAAETEHLLLAQPELDAGQLASITSPCGVGPTTTDPTPHGGTCGPTGVGSIS
jgi:hypothetical protein